MKKLTFIALGLLLLAPMNAFAETAPRRALTLDNANVVKYGARMRVTKNAWDFALLTIRDNFSTWTAPNGAAGLGGANLLLDPGYDFINHGKAGFVRTTPYLYDYVRYDSGIWRTNAGVSCSSGCVSGSCNYNTTCGQWCNKNTAMWPASEGYTVWTQVRRVGSALATNQPTIPPTLQNASRFREYGFYVADPVATPGQDFKQMQFCTNRGGDGDFYFDSGSGQSGPCQDAVKTFEVCAGLCTTVYFYYNVRLFIYPNMRTEYMGVNGTYPRDPVHSWENWNPTVNRGCYTGLTGGNVLQTIATVTNCSNGGYCTAGADNCNCITWICCVRWSGGCYAQNGVMSQYIYGWSMAGHAPTDGLNTRDGSYKRQGDDMSLYTNIGQMQIHSYERNTFHGVESTVNRRACQLERWYNGTNNGTQPNYSTSTAKIANCMYPKSYWDFTSSTWKMCDPFDTWNADGTLNSNNDDAKFLYPGHPDTGANPYGTASPGRCGRQPLCTAGSCVVQADGTYAPGSRTTRFKDLFSPGGGWYLLEIVDLQNFPGTNPPTSDPNTQPRMQLTLRIPNVRAELGAAITLRTEGTLVVDNTYRNIRAQGQIKFNAIDVQATIRIFSIDDKSCNPTYPATCAAPFTTVNDNPVAGANNPNKPDKLYFDITIDNFTITSPNPWYVGECDNVTMVLLRDPVFGTDLITATVSACDVLNDDITVWGINIGSVGIKDMLTGIVEDALSGEIKTALADFTAVIPNLNSILGDPINLVDKSFIETGVYATGGMNEKITMADNTARWPIAMLSGPTPEQDITDFRMSLGFRPIPFRPAGVNGVMDIDNNDPPLNDSLYGVPELWDPNTSGCTTTNCSIAGHAAVKDADQQMDNDDYAKTSSGFYRDPKTSAQIFPGQWQRLPEFFKGPISEFKKPPAWCSALSPSVGAPATIRSGGGRATDFATLYPQTTWLSFDPARDYAPSGSLMNTPAARNTFGNWDTMFGGTVYQQNLNNGTKDPNPVNYDLSLHIHQRTLAQFLQTAVASGMTCIEFATKDTEGADTPWKDFLKTDSFAMFFPGIASQFPNKYVKIRISSVGTPRARTGMGSLSYTPSINMGIPGGEAPLAIGPTPYMISAAFPDTRIEFLIEDELSGDIPLMTMYWTPVVGFHAQSVRRCYYLDPLVSDPQCTSTFVNVRTVSGYYELYLDIGSPSLKQAWTNGLDFPAGYFTDANGFDNIGTARFFDTGAPATNKSAVVIASTYCDNAACDKQMISNMIPTLMDSFISLFVVSRVSFMNLTMDFLYTGPDGPNDDGVGGGDYIGIYTRFLGSLNLFDMLQNLGGLLAPKHGLEPMAYVPGASDVQWFNTNRPALPVQMVRSFDAGESDIAYTYSLDGGFWKTQRNDPELKLGPLLEGEHKLQLRAVEHTKHGATASLNPKEVRFRVDSIAPEVTILPSKQGAYVNKVEFKVADAQTPADQLKISYSWNDGDWETTEDKTLSVRRFKPGTYTLRVRAEDLAGNVGESARRITTGEGSWWGCASNGAAPDASWLLILLAAMLPVFRGRANKLWRE